MMPSSTKLQDESITLRLSISLYFLSVEGDPHIRLSQSDVIAHEPDRFWCFNQKRESASILKCRGRSTHQIESI